MVKKWLFCIICVGILLFSAAFCASAEEKTSPTEQEGVAAFDRFRGAIPAEVADCLPDGFFSKDPAEAAAMEEAGSLSSVFSKVGQAFTVSFGKNLSLLATILGVLTLTALLRAVAGERKRTEKAFRFCTVTGLLVFILGKTAGELPKLKAYFSAFQTLGAALVPMMGTLYAMGGNVRAAVANHGVMTVFLSVSELLCSRFVLPVAGACIVLTLPDAITGENRLKPLCGLIKRTFALGLSFLMLLLSFLLGLQTTLAAGSDTLALRTVRFAAGNFLPVVGSSVSEALKTVAGSVAYLRTLAGTGGILAVFFLFLPMFVSVLMTRIVFLLSGAAAGMLGGGGEEKLLAELAAVYGYLLAVISALFVMTVFALTLFAHCAVAGG